jgi:hypothetical protein
MPFSCDPVQATRQLQLAMLPLAASSLLVSIGSEKVNRLARQSFLNRQQLMLLFRAHRRPPVPQQLASCSLCRVIYFSSSAMYLTASMILSRSRPSTDAVA